MGRVLGLVLAQLDLGLVLPSPDQGLDLRAEKEEVEAALAAVLAAHSCATLPPLASVRRAHAPVEVEAEAAEKEAEEE